jgi:hypothetical protein
MTLLNDPEHRNVFDDGGLKLSSASDESWLSKSALFQHVARVVLRLDDDEALAALFAKADAAQVNWQTQAGAASTLCDRFSNGQPVGGQSSPRAITTALWMDKAGR